MEHQNSANVKIRAAELQDVSQLEALIERSARELSRGHYSCEQAEAAIAHVFGVDTALIEDGSYLVAQDDQGEIIGCGGWSRQRTLFGGDRFAARESGFLDPAVDAAKIRAFFVDPRYARRGIGKRLLDSSERMARTAGFMRLELMATLPGAPFYEVYGYRPGSPVTFTYAGVDVTFVPMTKTLE